MTTTINRTVTIVNLTVYEGGEIAALSQRTDKTFASNDKALAWARKNIESDALKVLEVTSIERQREKWVLDFKYVEEYGKRVEA